MLAEVQWCFQLNAKTNKLRAAVCCCFGPWVKVLAQRKCWPHGATTQKLRATTKSVHPEGGMNIKFHDSWVDMFSYSSSRGPWKYVQSFMEIHWYPLSPWLKVSLSIKIHPHIERSRSQLGCWPKSTKLCPTQSVQKNGPRYGNKGALRDSVHEKVKWDEVVYKAWVCAAGVHAAFAPASLTEEAWCQSKSHIGTFILSPLRGL